MIDSLQRGNRQSVTLQHEGKEQKIFIEVSAQFKSLNFYDSSMKKVNVQSLYEKGEAQSGKQEIKKESLKENNIGDVDAGGPKQPIKKSRKKKQGIS